MSPKQLIIASLMALTGCGVAGTQDQGRAEANDWLLGAETDEDRFGLIQRQFRGFDQPMWEVGERYARLHEALERKNPELAAYHWKKIRTTVENGIAKRPGRRANAEQFLLNNVWSEVDEDLRSGDEARAWAGFKRAKNACQTCHAAEGVAYMNNQPVFDLTVSESAAQ